MEVISQLHAPASDELDETKIKSFIHENVFNCHYKLEMKCTTLLVKTVCLIGIRMMFFGSHRLSCSLQNVKIVFVCIFAFLLFFVRSRDSLISTEIRLRAGRPV
jgi:hypothetical protein